MDIVGAVLRCWFEMRVVEQVILFFDSTFVMDGLDRPFFVPSWIHLVTVSHTFSYSHTSSDFHKSFIIPNPINRCELSLHPK